MTEVTFRSDFDVQVVKVLASDRGVAEAARVSTVGAEADGDGDIAGLVSFLMKNRHGCYDAETEVLTRDGWKAWPQVTMEDEFLTLAPGSQIMEYQAPTRIVVKPYTGDMVKITGLGIDLFVTPNHKLLAQRRTNGGWKPLAFHDASEAALHSMKMQKNGGKLLTGPSVYSEEEAELLGFIVADAHIGLNGSTPSFHFGANETKKEYLLSLAARNGYSVRGESGKYSVVGSGGKFARGSTLDSYSDEGHRVVPHDFIRNSSVSALKAFLVGYLAGDGSVSPTGKVTASTISAKLADQLQELAVLTGGSASISERKRRPGSAYEGSTEVYYSITFYRDRRQKPRIGWTTADRKRQVSSAPFDGMVYCATVPNSTLYVRRNGVSTWCGNSPFEHNLFTWRISAPIFVWREFMRHRIASYNEESGRYKTLDPVFYIPPKHRPMVQVGKPGAYTYVAGDDEQYAIADLGIGMGCEENYERYEYMLAAGIAREVARMVLPVSIYSTAFVSMNARGLMNFLSLRTKSELSTYATFPQWEISQVADAMELEFARSMPLTHAAFNEYGRVCP